MPARRTSRARLTRRRHPGHEIHIFEQNPRDATYGFGVTLAGAARDRVVRLPCSIDLVGARGFEPPTTCTPCRYATRLRYAPIEKL